MAAAARLPAYSESSRSLRERLRRRTLPSALASWAAYSGGDCYGLDLDDVEGWLAENT